MEAVGKILSGGVKLLFVVLLVGISLPYAIEFIYTLGKEEGKGINKKAVEEIRKIKEENIRLIADKKKMGREYAELFENYESTRSENRIFEEKEADFEKALTTRDDKIEQLEKDAFSSKQDVVILEDEIGIQSNTIFDLRATKKTMLKDNTILENKLVVNKKKLEHQQPFVEKYKIAEKEAKLAKLELKMVVVLFFLSWALLWRWNKKQLETKTDFKYRKLTDTDRPFYKKGA